MNNAYADKAVGEKEKMQAKLDELKAQLKISAADARISVQNKISEIEAKLKAAT